MNNLKINSILDNRYGRYFGFTSEEIREMCIYYEVIDKYQEIKEWYNGYLFGESEIYNPWSVINYFSNDCKPSAFWLSTGSNEIIKEILANFNDMIPQASAVAIQGAIYAQDVEG